MKLNFHNCAGLYVFYSDYSDSRNCIILYSGKNGNPGLRKKVNQLYANRNTVDSDKNKALLMIKENMLRYGNFIVEGQNSDKNSFLEEKIGNPTVSRVCWRSISSNVDFSDIKIENM